MNTSNYPMQRFAFSGRVLVSALLVAIGLVAAPVQAQSSANGTITGTVSNAGTGAYLEGAAVEISSLHRRVLTDSTGGFTINDVPPGEREVIATYAGLNPVRKVVTVEAGQRASSNLELSSPVYQLKTLTVVGEREGNAAALTQQRNADNVVNVVSVDAYGNVADGNIGNFLQRLPGIATNKSGEGEITGLMLRGAPPNLSMVSLDGTRLAAAVTGGGANSGDRSPDISRIPAELIKQVEVNKALTPDMDADGIGGSVNLTTKSAFDFRQRYVNYRVAYSLNTYRDGNPWQPFYTLTAMDKFGAKQKLGVAFTGSYNKVVNPVDRVQTQYLEADMRNTTARLLDDTLTREKSGLGLKLEYRFDDTAAVWLNSFYTRSHVTSLRNNWQVVAGGSRRIADYSRVSRAAMEAGTAARDSLNQTAGVAPGFTDTYTELLSASLINQPANIGPAISDQFNFEAGGRKAWGDLEVTAKITYSPAQTTNDSSVASFTLPGIGVSVDTSGDLPVFKQLYGPNIWAGSDFSKYTMNYQYQPASAEEELYGTQIDLKRDFNRGRIPVQFKTGFKARRQHRTSVSNNPRWNYVGPDGVLGKNKTSGLNDDDLARFVTGPGYALYNGFYPSVDQVDVSLVQKAFVDHPEYFKSSGAVNDVRNTPTSEITEDVLAGYVMAKADLTQTLSVLGGVRFEDTSDDAIGTFTTNTSPVVTTTSRSGGYRNFFPSVHLNYTPLPNLRLRAAYTYTMARPAISSITPTTTVTDSSTTGGLGTVTQNNINLKPQFSTNYDFMAEYYLKSVGVFSAGLFRKDITDFIATFRRDIPSGEDNGFNGDYAGYVLNTSTNLGTAKIEGFELNYSQQLTGLPKPFNGLSIFGNYTHIKTSGSYDNGATVLANFVPETSNAGLSYSFRGLGLRVAYNYKSAYLLTYSPTPIQSAYQTEDATVDVNVQYQIRPWLTVYMDATNIFNKAPNTYSLNDGRIYVQPVYGTKVTFGFSGRF